MIKKELSIRFSVLRGSYRGQNRIERDKAQISKTCKKYGLNRQFAKRYKVPQFRGKYKWIQEKHIGWCLQSKVSDFM